MIIFVALSRNRLVNNLIAEGDSDSDSDGRSSRSSDPFAGLLKKQRSMEAAVEEIHGDVSKLHEIESQVLEIYQDVRNMYK